MPKVSIITALYNHEQYIAQAIESVLAQTYQDWEHIVWDDGSSDGSLALAEKYAARDSRIKIHRHPGGANRGQENTRNAALDVASGELICLLDSDDLYYPRKLEALVPSFDRSEVGLAYGRHDHLLESEGRRVPSGILVEPRGRVFGELARENFVGAGATLFRRACVASGMRFDAAFRTIGEYPLWLKIARDWEFAFVPETVATWRDHGANLGTKLALQAKEELVRLFERLMSDPEYSGLANEVALGLARKRYDFASVLYVALRLSDARAQCREALSSGVAESSIRAKAAVLYSLTLLGQAPNRHLARLKHRIWEARR